MMNSLFSESSLNKDMESVESFIEAKRKARRQRHEDHQKSEAALTLQRHMKGYLARRKLSQFAFERFEILMTPEPSNSLVPAKKMFLLLKFALRGDDLGKNQEMMLRICKYINWSFLQTNPSMSYVAYGSQYNLLEEWTDQLKMIVFLSVDVMKTLNPELLADSSRLSIFLTTIVFIISISNWKILSTTSYSHLRPKLTLMISNLYLDILVSGEFFQGMRSVLEAALGRPDKFALKKTNLLAIASLTSRIFKNEITELGRCRDLCGVKIKYVTTILSVPAFAYYIKRLCPEALDSTIFLDIIAILDSYIDNILELNIHDLLSLVANIVEIGQHYPEIKNVVHPSFCMNFAILLKGFIKRMENNKKTHWHPIFGWVELSIPTPCINASAAIKSQIQLLWSNTFLESFFLPLHQAVEKVEACTTQKSNGSTRSFASPTKSSSMKYMYKIFKKAIFFDAPSEQNHSPTFKMNSDVTMMVSRACELYSHIMATFSLCKLDILTALCFKQSSKLLQSLWKFLQLLERDAGVKGWIEILQTQPQPPQEFLLLLFADSMTHFVTILDDQEMYEEQKVFKLEEIAKIAQFVNQLCYKLISPQCNGKIRNNLWTSLKTLLMVFYRRDCRRKYCPEDYWLIESSKLISDIEKGRKHAKQVLSEMPHVLREDARVILFRKWATSEKAVHGSSGSDRDLSSSGGSHLITVQRGRIVEDGYAQLSALTPQALKSTIRVRFQNRLGLDEAGIDQDGVFKEFLEETISAVFDPSLNLFKATSENLLYPSPLSYLHENHLQLFEFVGKILAKAIFEGIVVDVHFAPYFLSQILGHQKSVQFSAIDELQSLDYQLYQSLNQIKHYDGDVQDLELTFSVDQDVLGEIQTVELTPGGCSTPVTNENKFSYLYLMAHFHLYVQIKDQTAAFLKGFRAIIPTEWIRVFSPPELQRLISGEDSAIDLTDLRRNTQYYGGFHDNHRVVIWLWEILEQDFSEEERKLFLKFVTSCSKPPLLGFMNLDPPFSIRCVEVSDDDDTGDTIGSVLRGFLQIGKKDPIGRLPTSSTCFNLLKLPNYQKKSTLREKLRYAITANTGFELS